MDSFKSLADILQYAEKHGISSLVVIGVCVLAVISWLAKKGGSKAISVVGGVLDAADKMLEAMQKRQIQLEKALQRSEDLTAHYREKNDLLQMELHRVTSSLAQCHEDCRECRKKLQERN